MIVKSRLEPVELKLRRSLNARMELSEEERSRYYNLEKGYKGELKFDERLAKKQSKDWLIVNDLLFELNHTVFQIDSLVITPEMTYLFEVKNYEGDFFIEKDKWYKLPKKEISNPLLQLERNESLFRRLLQEYGFNTRIEAYLVFVNPDFLLYQVPLNLPIIFPNQIDRFLNKANTNSSSLKNIHQKLTEKLISIHQNDSPYKRIPNYRYEQLEKGIMCKYCYSISSYIERSLLICSKCRNTEDSNTAILRTVEEYILLFPNRKVTTHELYKWCKGMRSMSTLLRILNDNYILKGNGKASYFEKITNN